VDTIPPLDSIICCQPLRSTNYHPARLGGRDYPPQGAGGWSNRGIIRPWL